MIAQEKEADMSVLSHFEQPVKSTLSIDDAPVLEKAYFSSEHISVFDNFYTQEFCKSMIDYFNYRNNFVFKRNTQYVNDASLTFGHETDMRLEYELFQKEDASNCMTEFQTVFWRDCFPLYTEEHPHIIQNLAKLDWSVIKIQKTKPKEGYHVFHCEQADMFTARRAMFVILYLNDIKEGGETEFVYQSKRVEAKAGRLILAPAAYTHVHRGNPPLSEDKYILTSWLEFMA